MYHLKADRRCVKSAEKLSNTLFVLLEKMPYKDISINKLCAESQVSRKTFYNHFNTIDDIFYFLLDKLFLDFEKDLYKVPRKKILKYVLEMCFVNIDLFIKIVHAGKQNIVTDCFNKHQNRYIESQKISDNKQREKLRYKLKIAGFIIQGALSDWYNTGQKEDVDQIYGKMIEATSNIYRTYTF